MAVREVVVIFLLAILTQINYIESHLNHGQNEIYIDAYNHLSWKQSEVEDNYRRGLNSDRIRDSLKYYTSKDHLAGTQNDFEQAQWTAAQYRLFGIPDVRIDEYFPLINYPGPRSLSLWNGQEMVFNASLTEGVVDDDPTSHNQNAVPTFHGYGCAGKVKARLVYAGFGGIDDFKALEKAGINVKGNVVIVRYGGQFRGIKVRAAEFSGAKGVLIYSDPQDDGFVRGPVYPNGPWRSNSSVQRGSVQYGVLYDGDPLTPGKPALKNATRISKEKANIPKIPSLPISYGDAEPLLRALINHGKKASEIRPFWQGGLEFEYFTGPSMLEVNLSVEMDYDLRPIWNVMGTIPGIEEPDRAVVVGNHRDAWVFGAVDPNSGSSAHLEMVRSMGQMLKNGWRPARTIIFANWDGEEYGLVGSTEYVENYPEFISKEVVAYINIDTGVSGPNFHASASPLLANLIRSVTKDVIHPNTGKPVYDDWVARNPEQTPVGPAPSVPGLGSGSDYVAFLQHEGVASIDMAFSGPYGVYHSNYDSFTWMAKYGDPTWQFHLKAAEILGILTLRIATLPILPFDPTSYPYALLEYTADIAVLLDKMPEMSMNMRIFNAILGKKTNPKHISLHDIYSAIGEMYTSARFLSRAIKGCANETVAKRRQINDLLAFSERHFLDENGVPGRVWFKHVLFAAGLWAGYAVKVYPAIREAIAEGDPDIVQRRIDRISVILKRVSEAMRPH